MTRRWPKEVLTWDDSANNRSLLAGTASLVLNAVSITRTAENKQLPIGEQIWLARVPQGPGRRLAPVNAMRVAGIWTFAAQIDGAKQFLVDLIGQHRQAFVASEFYTFPSFPQTVPDLQTLLAHDAKATPPDKYAVLADAGEWTTNVGYPGYTNAAIGEVYTTGVISRMFAQAATGKLSPEEALAQADAQVQSVFKKWKERGKI
jgi:multiple sugar transport system substrate-binding protein